LSFTAVAHRRVSQSKAIHADLNIGPTLWRLESRPLVQEERALAVSRPLSKGLPLTAMFEVYGFTDAAPVVPRDAGILVGLSWTVRRNLVLDAGGASGDGIPTLGEASNSQFVWADDLRIPSSRNTTRATPLKRSNGAGLRSGLLRIMPRSFSFGFGIKQA
jgi:hypothetical protein